MALRAYDAPPMWALSTCGAGPDRRTKSRKTPARNILILPLFFFCVQACAGVDVLYGTDKKFRGLNPENKDVMSLYYVKDGEVPTADSIGTQLPLRGTGSNCNHSGYAS